MAAADDTSQDRISLRTAPVAFGEHRIIAAPARTAMICACLSNPSRGDHARSRCRCAGSTDVFRATALRSRTLRRGAPRSCRSSITAHRSSTIRPRSFALTADDHGPIFYPFVYDDEEFPEPRPVHHAANMAIPQGEPVGMGRAISSTRKAPTPTFKILSEMTHGIREGLYVPQAP